MTTKEHQQPALADDLIWDVVNIAAECNLTPRQARYMIENGQLPVIRMGSRKYAALRSELRRRFSNPNMLADKPIPTRVPPRDKPHPRIKVPKRKLHRRQD
jgi:hypothetical protein